MQDRLAVAPPAAGSSHPQGEVKGEAILVLDDDTDIRELLKLLVESIGGVPHLAASIGQAQRLAAKQPFACAVIDKNLGAENGLDFLGWIKASQPDCEALIVTGYGNMQTAIEALRIGASDYLLKPFEIEIISHRIRTLCERRRGNAERLSLQARLMQTDRLATLGTLAAGVVHEINNPLTYVLSNLEFLQDRLGELRLRRPAGTPELGPADAELAELVTLTADSIDGARQMAAVVRHIKTFAHHDEAQRSRTKLTPLVEGALKMSTVLIRQRAKLRRDFSVVPDVDALEFQLAQVFLNLLVNASQAIPEGDAARNEIGVRLSTSAAGEAVVEVSDTGTGMTPEVLARLFQPFFTTKPAGVGTGIGLTICKNIVESHGGQLEVESRPGKGSVFRVRLPGRPDSRGDGRPKPAEGPVSLPLSP